MEWEHSKILFHCKTLYKEQSGSRSSKFVKQNMEDENVLQLIINSENLSITVDSDSEKWSFNLYSCGYHEYTNIWAPLIGDESLICQKKDMCMILMLWSLFEERLSSKMSPKIYAASFGNFLCLPNTSIRARVLSKMVNRVVRNGLEIPVCLLSKVM